nr:retrovirus-related Pol polyprotein from transposon TNT 1-94 [Tanacetum cinerariifolium]GEX49806.1 retrovirus-related Pol polyprotein from transposon TNT 1-94 [Tanacetum cinerariifolium]
MESQKSLTERTQKISDLNQMNLEMKKRLFAHQKTVFIMSQEKEAQIKFYKTREDKEIDKVIALENKVKVLDDIVYKTGQSIQTMNMLNCNYKMSFPKHEFLKKAQRMNPRLYDIELSKNNTMSKSFEALQKHPISLELALHQCQEQIKNDKAFTENHSNVFQKEHEHYFEIQDLKAQLQDKGIVISELKKLIEKIKGKSVETKFEKSSVIRQPIAFKSQRQSVIGVIPTTSISITQLKSNQMEDRVMPNNSQEKKQEVEDQRRNFKFLNNKTSITPIAVPISTREPKRNVNQFIATSRKKTVAIESTVKKPRSIIRKLYKQVSNMCWWYPKFTPSEYKWKHKSLIGNGNANVSTPLGNASRTANILEPMTPRCSTLSNTPLSSNSLPLIEIILFIIDSGCSKHMTGNLKLLSNFVEKFLGLNHNLLFVGQLFDVDLDFSFWKSTCYIRDLKGNDLLIGSCGTDIYSITLQDTSTPNPICLMAKSTSSQAWLWHHRLSHLNFDTIKLLSKNDIVTFLTKLKFTKDHLCSSYELGKSKRKYFHTKTTLSSKRRLQLLYMDLCGPMRVESINGKKYDLIIFDDYSKYTWTHFLRSKDETPKVLIDILTLVQRGLHAQVRIVQTDKGTKLLNKTLYAYFAKEGLRHETSTA